MTKTFPPFELQATAAALDLLESEIRGYAVEQAGPYVSAVWLRGVDGRIWIILTDTRDLQFKFEVFTLAIDTLEALQARVAAWTPPKLPDDTPDALRRIFSTKPPIPTAPEKFEPWPFARWRCDVLRRTEFIIEDVEPGPTVGSSPNFQSAARPGVVPSEASAACEVAAGLLFTGVDGERLLAAVSWTPSNIIWTRDAAQIAEYVKYTEAVSLRDYRRSLALSG